MTEPKMMQFRVTDQNGKDITDEVTISAVEVPGGFGVTGLTITCPACGHTSLGGNVLPEHSNSGMRCPGSGVLVIGASQ